MLLATSGEVSPGTHNSCVLPIVQPVVSTDLSDLSQRLDSPAAVQTNHHPHHHHPPQKPQEQRGQNTKVITPAALTGKVRNTKIVTLAVTSGNTNYKKLTARKHPKP